MASYRESLATGNNPTIKDFVLQEAHQRAFEVSVLSLKDYEKQRTRILNERRNAQQVQFEKKHKDAEAANRIHKSALINGSRMRKMQARHGDLLKVVAASEIILKEKIIKNTEEYKKLMKKLIIEGLIKMLEPIVYIRCLLRDRELVRSILGDCKNEFRSIIVKEGIDESVANVDLRLEERYFLNERKIGEGVQDKTTKGEENNKCFGGVVLTSEDGLIVCKNTLDSRIDLAYQHMLPTIRTNLFH